MVRKPSQECRGLGRRGRLSSSATAPPQARFTNNQNIPPFSEQFLLHAKGIHVHARQFVNIFQKRLHKKKKVAQKPTNAGIFVNFLLVIFLYRTVICANFSKVGIVLNARLWKLLCPLGNMTGFFYSGFPHH